MFDIVKSVSRHFFVYGLGNILNRIVAFLLIPLYTHYLTASDYGVIELLELTTSMAGILLAVGVSFAVTRFYYDAEDEFHKRQIVSTAHITAWGFGTVLGLSMLAFSGPISNLVLGGTQHVRLLQMTFLTLIFSVAGEVPFAYLRIHERSGFFTVVSLARFTGSVLLNILLLAKFGWGIRGIVWSSFLTQVVTTLFLSIYTISRVGISFSTEKMRAMMKYGFPYLPGGLSRFVLNFADRFFLQRLSGLTDVGLYALGCKFGMIVNPIVTDPFRSIWNPKMFELSKRPDASQVYSRMMTYYLLAALFAGLGISVMVKDVLVIMSPPEFQAAYQVVPVIALGYIAWGAHFSAQIGLLLAKQTKYVAISDGTAAILNTILNILLIPKYGMWGAAWATLISFLVLLIISRMFSDRYLTVVYEYGRIAKMMICWLAIYFTAVWLHFDSPILGIAVRFLLACLFPVLLLLLRFYEPEELEKARMLTGEAWQRARGWARL